MAPKPEQPPEYNKLPADGSTGLALLPTPPSVPVRSSFRHYSAPTLLRGGWRRRASTNLTSTTLITASEQIKGSLGLNLLHEPSEPRIDFIFVHGLHGGSRKTWSFNPEDSSTFWPEQWLPYESGFKHVRIHSFGYDSDWSKASQSALRIRDFSQALLENIVNSQTLKRNRNTQIVFVAHSMGGLVVKQAYLLAKQQAQYRDIASRIHTLYFLGTPHRGASSASYVKTYLSVVLPTATKAYVKELLPDSQTVNDINDDFRHICKDLHLWSFFESIPTSGVMIVDKSSAVIGLPNERVQYLQADHRHICKYRDVTDPNYRILQDRLKTTIDMINEEGAVQQSTQMKAIAKALDVLYRPENDLLSVVDKCHRGTCEWLTEGDSFQTWLDFDGEVDPLKVQTLQKQPRFIWLKGPPGSGKSVASGHVVTYLTSQNLDCSHFFFKNDTKATVTQLLLSLAYQMAEHNFEARQMFLAMVQNGDEINTKDHTVIWNNLFLGRLFKINFSQPQFWVIDGLDECPKKSLVSLIQKFAKIDPAVPLRIFLTSRPDSPNAPVEQLFNEEKIDHIELLTGQESSTNDIALFIRSRPRLWRLMDGDESGKIISSILERSRGIFLWAALTVAGLDDLYSIEDIKDALQQVPSEMNGFYAKILETVTNSTNASKARCILKWVVCAPSPMTAEELKEAVRHDIGHTLLDSGSSDIFSEICGSLVNVDHEGRVQLMHQTVREFLIGGASNFFVNYRQAHEEIAAMCLRFLSEPMFARQTARRPKAPKASNAGASRDAVSSAFAEYGSANFSHHLRHSQSTAPELFSSLVKFAKTKSLVWIERIARGGRLSPFIVTIQNVKPYIIRQLETGPPFTREYQSINAWVNDLTRLVTIFGQTLIESPDAIYAFVPLLCPTSSMIHETFAAQSPQKIICSSNENWDERLSCILLQSPGKAVASRDQHIAVGLVNGAINVLSSSTFEAEATLKHGGAVRHLAFGNISNILVSCCPKKLILWDERHKELWNAPLSSAAASVCFSADDSKVFVALRTHADQIRIFSTKDGTSLDTCSIVEERSDSSSDSNSKNRAPLQRFCPELVVLAPILGYAAVAYRSSHLAVYSMDEDDNLDRLYAFKREGSESLPMPPPIVDVVFNPAVEFELAAVAYRDGVVITVHIDDWTAAQTHAYPLHARVLASSPDGRTLAAGEVECSISLFAFDTLQLLHRVDALEEAVTRIIFASNSLRLYDVRVGGRVCNIWEPGVLVRKPATDDNSSDPDEVDLTAVAPSGPTARPFDDSRSITAMAAAGDDRHVFCGREDGSVSVHELKSGDVSLELRLHSASIRQVEWDPEARLLLTVDASPRVIATKLVQGDNDVWAQAELVFNRRAASAVTQALIRPGGAAVLLSTRQGEELWQEDVVQSSEYSLKTARWVQHPTDKTRLLLFDNDNQLRVHLWDGLEREAGTSDVSIVLPPDFADLPLTNNWTSRMDISILWQTVALPASQSSSSAFLMLDMAHVQPAPDPQTVSPTVRKLLRGGVKTIVSLTRSSIFFLTRGGWISSVDTSAGSLVAVKSYIRHLFIPPFWRNAGELFVTMPSKNSIAIAYRDDLIIIHRFKEFEHRVPWED